MEKIMIEGGYPLEGEIKIGGAKNSAVAILPGVLLADSPCVLRNLPKTDDLTNIFDILDEFGVKRESLDKNSFHFDCSGHTNYQVSFEHANKMRASYYFLGILLSKFGRAEVPMPGGCDIGSRPIDLHIKGMRALGANVMIENGIVKASAKQLTGTHIFMDVVSVGATINLMFAACKAKGTTILDNAAKEPYIVDVANFLNHMGARITGAGTDVIKIIGVDKLHGCEHSIIPDMMEAGTYMIAAAATRGKVLIDHVIPTHLDAVISKLIEMGAKISIYEDSILVEARERLNNVNVRTQPYPGFATDLQQPLCALFSISRGVGMITENIWESRFKYVDELKRMGAKISVNDRTAVVEGVEKLYGANVVAHDLRAGAAMIVAGLVASGTTVISNIVHIDRGYEYLEEKLSGIGAKIQRIP